MTDYKKKAPGEFIVFGGDEYKKFQEVSLLDNEKEITERKDTSLYSLDLGFGSFAIWRTCINGVDIYETISDADAEIELGDIDALDFKYIDGVLSGISKLTEICHKIAVDRGQWKNGIHGALKALRNELHELVEAVHFGNSCPFKATEIHSNEEYFEKVAGTIEDELADVVICCLSIAGELKIDDFGMRIAEKIAYNSERGKK